jgi:type I restriction enzyme S subunit
MSAECSSGNIPPGYKQTEVGVIPEDWGLQPLGELVTFLDGKRKPVKDADRAKMRGSIPYYGASGIVDYVNDYLFDEDLILLGEDGENILSRACRLAFRISGKTWVNNHAHVLRPNPDISIGFLTDYLESLNYERFNSGTAQPKLNKQTCFGILIALPPTLAEQEAIAEALGDADAFIESLEQLITKKRQIKQGAMQELLTGKRKLPGFSGEWEVKLLGDLFDFSGGLSASRDQLSMEGYCYLHYGDIHTSTKNFINVRSEQQDIPKLDISLKKVSSNSLLDDGDVVFVDASEDEEGTSRHIVVFNKDKIPFISGLHTIVAKSKTNELNNQYRRYCFQTADIKQQFRFFAVGTKVSGISKTNIAKLTLPVPSIPEQTAIASILSDMDSEITALEEKLAKARQIKQGMMQELLTGRIRLL